MIIRNAEVFCEDGSFQIKDVYIDKHKIVAEEAEVMDKTVIDGTGYKLIPGLVDVHSHGAYGHDFCDCDVEGLKEILRYEKAHGITSYCPTSMTLSKEMLLKIFATAKEVQDMEDGARVVGINMEGPFISPEKKGAQNAAYIQAPDVKMFRACNEVSGNLIKLVTLAPEMEGAMEFIEEVKEEVHVSIGHTTAGYEIANEAYIRGADHTTHLFNAMPLFAHRDPGVIGAAYDAKNSFIELISDGMHIHESVVRSVFAMFGPERVVLISDSMMATGMENGTYELGGQKVFMKDRKATLENGTLAGSATNLYECMRKAMKFGVSEAEAIFAATRNPAKSIGIYNQVGSIMPGKEADLLLVDLEYQLKKVL